MSESTDAAASADVSPSGEFERRLAALSSARPYRSYLHAREQVLTMLDNASRVGDPDAAPSDYWSGELANVEYMLDASPLIVDRLRQHCYHITGIWPYNYGPHRERSRAQHAAKLDALMEAGDPSLFVPESPLLGGFGFDFEQGLVNVDTLKFFEVLIALDRAELLAPFKNGSERLAVWEIGAGWGGFAHAFKTLFPNTTYVISDLPQVYLFSAPYLMSAFPDATFTFHLGDGTSLTDEQWRSSDFVFAPAHALDAIRPPRLDLAVNMVSFQEMTTAQVERYVAHAHDCEVPFLYSLNRERSRYNPELRGVAAIASERYWLHEVEVLAVTYQQFPDVIPALDRGHKKKLQQGAAASEDRLLEYRHLVGWRRIST